jgi:hypothetical protein
MTRLVTGACTGTRSRSGERSSLVLVARWALECISTRWQAVDPTGAGPADAARPTWQQEEALDVDAENLLAKAADNLSVRRAFGTAYEKDGILIIPVAIVAGGGGGAQEVTGAVARPPVPVARPRRPPRRTTSHRRTQGALRQEGASAGWCCPQAPTS